MARIIRHTDRTAEFSVQLKEAKAKRDNFLALESYNLYVYAGGTWEDQQGNSIFATGRLLELEWDDLDKHWLKWVRVRVDGEWVKARPDRLFGWITVVGTLE